MKVLFAPSNIASFSSILSKALNNIDNVKAKGLSLGYNKYWAFSEGWTVIRYISWKKNPFKRLYQEIYGQLKLLQLILWADIIHWQWDIKGQTVFNIHYWLIKLLNKPIVIEWLGSELRIPEVMFEYNLYYKRLWNSGEYDYYIESKTKSLERQVRFKRLNALPALCPEMTLYLDKKIFKDWFLLYPRVDIHEYFPNYPNELEKVPIIVHTPSVKKSKGTDHVRKAISSLKTKGLHFEYLEIYDLSKQEALNAIHKADIFLDQFITGNYGMASCEAMAMGKPVFCYLVKPVVQLLPKECPIVNTEIISLEDNLEQFIKDGKLRHEVGKKSRQYVEKYHNVDIIAKEILEVYQSLLTRSSEKTNQAISV